jgi:hypothetical protein
MRRCAQGFYLVVILLFSGALIFDDMAILLAAGALLSGLAGQYVIFDRRFRQTVGSVRIQRSLERTLVRKGTTLRMTTTITLQVPVPMQVRVTETIPSGIALQDGETTITAVSTTSMQSHLLSCLIMPVIHGEIHFPGVSLVARDMFFENSIDLFSEQFSGPVLFVQPAGLFEPSSKRAIPQTREIERVSTLSGLSVRALREYYAGDDLRRIDWKLSAKHDRLFVREYSGVLSLPPLLVVDLPSRDAPFNLRDFERMVAAVAGMAEHSVKIYRFVSILLISGANIIHYTGEIKDPGSAMSLLREWMHPVRRTVHLYRTPDRSDLRSRIRIIGIRLDAGTDPRTTRFLESLRKHSLVALQHQKMHAFAGQLIRIFFPLAVDEIYLFSLAVGDASHLRLIVRQAKSMRLRVHVRMPGSPSPVSRRSSQIRLGADTVEVFA